MVESSLNYNQFGHYLASTVNFWFLQTNATRHFGAFRRRELTWIGARAGKLPRATISTDRTSSPPCGRNVLDSRRKLRMRLRIDGSVFYFAARGKSAEIIVAIPVARRPVGCGEKPPPQFGQTLPSTSSTQGRQNVHSNVQIIASIKSGGGALLQFSQVGLSSSIDWTVLLPVREWHGCNRCCRYRTGSTWHHK